MSYPQSLMQHQWTFGQKLTVVAAFSVVLAISMMAELAVGGTGGTAFQSIYTDLSQWSQGYLGRLVVLMMVVVGIVAGVARQSLSAFAVGAGGGIGVYNAPDIVDLLVSATLPMPIA